MKRNNKNTKRTDTINAKRILSNVRRDIAPTRGRRRPPRRPRTTPVSGISSGAVKYFNALTQPFHPLVSMPHVPDAYSRPSMKATYRIRELISIVAGIDAYIFLRASCASDKAAIVILNQTSGSPDTGSQVINAVATTGASWSYLSPTELPYDCSALASGDISYRAVSAGFKITPLAGPSARSGAIVHHFSQDVRGLADVATSTPDVISANNKGPHTRIHNMSDPLPFEVTLGPFHNAASAGTIATNDGTWITASDTATQTDLVGLGEINSVATSLGASTFQTGYMPTHMIQIASNMSGQMLLEFVGHVEYTGGAASSFVTPSPSAPDVNHIQNAVHSARSKHGNSASMHFSEVAHHALREVIAEIKSNATAVASRLIPIVQTQGMKVAGAALAALI